MTSQPPSSAESAPQPPRPRPTLSSFAQDTTEVNLWAFDDELDSPERPADSPAAPPLLRPPGNELPAPRDRHGGNLRSESPSFKPSAAEQIHLDVRRMQAKILPDGPLAKREIPDAEFDDIESWDPVPDAPAVENPPVGVEPGSVEASPVKPAAMAAAEFQPYPVPPADVKSNEVSPVVRHQAPPVSLRQSWGLALSERISLILLLVLLLSAVVTIVVLTLRELPRETQRAKATDFPLRGTHLTIGSATSYWRAPLVSGDSPDTVRRGTQLLPVCELTVRGGPAAVRVLFRNEDRALVGDTVTRSVRDGDTVQIPATAGFDDPGMHAAYRTGQSKPWVIEVLEAPSEDAPATAFKYLFEMHVSTDRR